MTVTHNYDNQIGGIIIGATEGDNEYTYIIRADTDHGAGTTTYSMEEFEGEQVYSRNVPNTPEWKAQAFHDMEEVARLACPGEEIYLHEDDA